MSKIIFINFSKTIEKKHKEQIFKFINYCKNLKGVKVCCDFDDLNGSDVHIFVGDNKSSDLKKVKANYYLLFLNPNQSFFVNSEIDKKLCVSFDLKSIFCFVEAAIDNDIELGTVIVSNGFMYYNKKQELIRRVLKTDSILYGLILSGNIKKYKKYLPKIEIYKQEDDFIDIKVEKIQYLIRHSEWTNYQKIDCFMFLLDFICDLYKDDLTLHDPHILNVVYNNCFPIYLDFGSIKEISTQASFGVYSGIFSWLSFMSFLPKNVLVEINKIKSLISNSKDKIKQNMKVFEIATELKKILQQVSDYKEKNSVWNNYNNKFPDSITEYLVDVKDLNKISVVFNFLKQFSEEDKTIVDVGCNNGYFSFMADMLGYKVLGFDTSFEVINVGNILGKKRKSNVSFCSFDLLNPPLPVGFGDRGGHVFDRFRSNICLAAAVTHHLYKAGGSFAAQAKCFNSLTKKHLLVEFIPSHDIHLKQWGLPASYNIDNFKQALKDVGFKIVWQKDSNPNPRQWIYFVK